MYTDVSIHRGGLLRGGVPGLGGVCCWEGVPGPWGGGGGGLGVPGPGWPGPGGVW